jgi:hypothetical protein
VQNLNGQREVVVEGDAARCSRTGATSEIGLRFYSSVLEVP